MPLTATESYEKRTNESRFIVVDCTHGLEDGETISSVDAGAPIPSSGGPTISSRDTNDADMLIDGRVIQEGKAITCFASGGTAGVDYELVFNITTSQGQDIEVDGVELKVTAAKGT